MFSSLTAAIGITCIIAGGYALSRYKDVFHPAIYLAGLLLCLYVAMPGYLIYSEGVDILDKYFVKEEIELVQFVNLVGCIAILLGCLVGSSYSAKSGAMSGQSGPRNHEKMRDSCATVGLIGTAIFAYVRPTIGGWAESGYLRDAYLITLPALVGLMLAYRGRRPGIGSWALIAIISTPLILLGVLTGRRGPTFMIAAALGVGWYSLRQTRPSFWKLLLAGAALGALLLLLVANREQSYQLDTKLSKGALTAVYSGPGNEFIFGGGQIVSFDNTGTHQWGKQYIIDFLVRPIPKELWPNKYEDAWNFLGMDRFNLSTEGYGFGPRFVMKRGWKGPPGAAPGLIADLWANFSWFLVLPAFVIGRAYGRTWRRSVNGENAAIINFAVLTALSLYLIWQDLEAFGFRLLIMVAVVWFISRVRETDARGSPGPRGPVPAVNPHSPRVTGMNR